MSKKACGLLFLALIGCQSKPLYQSGMCVINKDPKAWSVAKMRVLRNDAEENGHKGYELAEVDPKTGMFGKPGIFSRQYIEEHTLMVGCP